MSTTGYSYDIQTAAIDRKRKLAEMLMQAQGPATNQMAGGMVVKNSPLSVLAPLLQQGAGAFIGKQADKEQTQLAGTRQKQLGEWLQNMPGTDPVQPVMPSTGFSDPTRQAGYQDAVKASDEAGRREKLGWALRGQDLGPIGQAIGGSTIQSAFTAPKVEYQDAGDRILMISDGKTVGSIAKGATPDAQLKASEPTEFERQLTSAGFKRGTPEFQGRLNEYLTKKSTHAPAAATNVTLNTEKNLYGTMADAQGKENVSMYAQAQKAPELLDRAQRVKQILGTGDAITGAGANQLLMLSKVANQLGFNTGDAAGDTEALGRELAASTLDQIKSSGLGAGSGFSNADRDFLERVVGGTITLEASTIGKLADLNERAALKTIDRWNATAGRLDPTQLKSLGMSQIQTPKGPATGGAPKLQPNPDGSYTYTP